jgi:competence protein ComEC
MKQLSQVEQTIASLSTFFKKGISLTFAVNITLLPLLLFHFHQFPLLGLIYNLFFPFFVGIALFFLCMACICHLLFTPLATPLFWMTSAGTEFLLHLSTYPPLPISYTIRTDAVSSAFVIGSLFLVTLIAITRYQSVRTQSL